ncbi:sodium:proton antiporter [Kineosporia sp. J2-2]|uniref:Sodium:proton antiporter n=1 Tax=Kineosporia corallincola TaxID=2835133 RepID=A0ABS5TR50_9ACTN|nr:sodium:proton antiporter [Kineosporia corallincola]MBT0773083.1 sodium:proton antiporter [Kineosporia corallincola]
MNGVQLLLVVIAAITVTGLAHRKGLQAPLVVLVIGLAASFIPGMPQLELEPHFILGIVLPPLLYSTALDFSVPSFVRNIQPILRLGVALVLITAFAVAGVAYYAVPEMTFGAALVLGAVVGPPDAVTAVAIGRALGVPPRVMTILTGESLINDAAALTLFSVGVAGVTGSHTVVSNPLLFFVYTSAVGLVVGIVLAVLVLWIRTHLHDPGLETVLGLVVPFAAYLLAEELHGSGVLAVVMAGFWIGHNSATSGFAVRLQERQVWRSIDILLEAFVFAYMGLQMKFIIDDVFHEHHEPVGEVLLASLLVLLTVMAVRPVWIFAFASGKRLIRQSLRTTPAPQNEHIASGLKVVTDKVGAKGAHWQTNALLSWTGMRGVVTLAAAAGVPLYTEAGEPFPGRSVLQFAAFVVAVGTLLIQGLTLPYLVKRLDISSDVEHNKEMQERKYARDVARAASRQAVRDTLADPPDGCDPALLEGVAERFRHAQETREDLLPDDEDDPAQRELARKDLTRAVRLLRQRMLTAQRQALIAERDAGNLDDEVLRDLLEQLDYEEAATATSSAARL